MGIPDFGGDIPSLRRPKGFFGWWQWFVALLFWIVIGIAAVAFIAALATGQVPGQ